MTDKNLVQANENYAAPDYADVIESLSGRYTNIFLVNLKENIARTIKLEGYVSSPEMVDKNVIHNYTFAVERFIRQRVKDDDQQMVIDGTKPEIVLAKLEEDREYNLVYRISEDDQIHHHQIKFARTRVEDWIVMAFLHIDDLWEEERRISDTLQKALNDAEIANKAKSTFLANMSHDIRTPMNAIVGYATIALSHLDNPDQVKRSLENIRYASEHLQNLINDVLDMSRIESGKEKVNSTKASLTKILQNLLPVVQSQIQSKQIDFRVSTTDLVHDTVFCDVQKVRQIIVNIISNAVKYTNEGGCVSVVLKETELLEQNKAHYSIAVNDTGIGMSQDFIQRMFDPFEREKYDNNEDRTGTGLGLSIVKSYVDLLGGNIIVNSELGSGTEFVIELDLPYVEKPVLDAKIEALKEKRVLVVDDDFQNCDTLTHMLSDIGMNPDWTTVPKEAVLRAKKAFNDGESYFAYIIDYIMPEISGIELAKRIRQVVNEDIPIILLSAYSWEDVSEEAKEAGITALCTKPMFIDDLVNVFVANLSGGAEASAEESKTDAISFTGEHILLAEDSKINQEIETVLLEDMGFTVTTVDNGAEAVEAMEKAKDWEYDYIIMDVRMPIMDGLEATRRIRAMKKEYQKSIPIVALTANAFEEDVTACLDAGMNVHMSKPFKEEDLGRILDSLRKGNRKRKW